MIKADNSIGIVMYRNINLSWIKTVIFIVPAFQLHLSEQGIGKLGC